MAAEIYLKDVMRQVRLLSGHDKTFSISYRKKDGTYGQKTSCRNRSGYYHKQKPDLASIRHENKRAGRAYLEYRTEAGSWKPFEVYWCLMVKFQNRTIDHRF